MWKCSIVGLCQLLESFHCSNFHLQLATDMARVCSKDSRKLAIQYRCWRHNIGCTQRYLSVDSQSAFSIICLAIKFHIGLEYSIHDFLLLATTLGNCYLNLVTSRNCVFSWWFFQRSTQIRSFPSREFYDEALEDGRDIIEQTKRSWHDYRCFGPFTFFDIHEGKESQPSGSGSWVNVDEVDFVFAMYHRLVTKYPELKSSSRLAIISPYRYQVKLFRDKYKETFGVASEKFVDINTVDGFQVKYLYMFLFKS